jgi:hypothetical protein
MSKPLKDHISLTEYLAVLNRTITNTDVKIQISCKN